MGLAQDGSDIVSTQPFQNSRGAGTHDYRIRAQGGGCAENHFAGWTFTDDDAEWNVFAQGTGQTRQARFGRHHQLLQQPPAADAPFFPHNNQLHGADQNEPGAAFAREAKSDSQGLMGTLGKADGHQNRLAA